MEPEAEYQIPSKIYEKKKNLSPLWTVVKVVLILYAAVALFKILMDGRVDFEGIFGNILFPLVILGMVFFQNNMANKADGYRPIQVTIRLFRDSIQMIYGMYDYRDGAGARVRLYELPYSEISFFEYSEPLECMRIAGRCLVREYQNDYLVLHGEDNRHFEGNQDLHIYLLQNNSKVILSDITKLSGRQVNYLK